jgi:hypothetical protein
MKLSIKKVVNVEAKRLKIDTKVSDAFCCSLLDQDGHEICSQECGYVPNFMPENFGGDCIVLDIDLDSGQILNWKKDEESLRAWIDKMNIISEE